MGGQSSGPSFTPTQTMLDPELRPRVDKALSEAERLYELGGPEYYTGQNYISPSAQTTSALELATTRAKAGSPLLRGAQGSIQNLMGTQSPYESQYAGLASGGYVDPNKSFYESLKAGEIQNEALAGTRATSTGKYLGGSPYLESALAQANRLSTESLQEGIRGLQSKTSMAGRYGSGAEQQLATKMGDAAARALAEQNQQAYLQNYQQERALQEQALQSLGGLSQQELVNRVTGATGLGTAAQQAFANQMSALSGAQGVRQSDIATQLQAAGMAPGLAAADYADIDRLLAAGQVSEGYVADRQRAAKEEWDYNQMLPYQTLQNFGAFITGLPRGGITKEYKEPGKKSTTTAKSGNSSNNPRGYDVYGEYGYYG
jgi:hypothetical protein